MGKRIDLDVRQDGVYLVLDNTEGKVTNAELSAAMGQMKIKNMDFTAILGALQSNETIVEKLISTETNLDVKDETVSFAIERDALKAYITFIPPGLGGRELSIGEIEKAAESAGIRYGLDKMTLGLLTQKKVYNEKILIAKGIAAKNGEDGYLKYYIDTDKRKPRPKELEDGSVDFRNMQLIELIAKGSKIVEMFPPTPGITGKSVLGKDLSAKMGKKVVLPTGKNCYKSEDGTKLYSSIDGMVVMQGNSINVLNALEIRGDVGPETGNINFNGTVSIRGTVLTGYSVTADGDISIEGAIEDADVTSGGSVLVKGGIHGSSRTRVKATKDIIMKHAANANLHADGDIIVDTLMLCEIYCGGDLKMAGKHMSIIGGNTRVLGKLTARTIGAGLEGTTVIVAGADAAEMRLYYQMQDKQKSMTFQMEEYLNESRPGGRLEAVQAQLAELNDEIGRRFGWDFLAKQSVAVSGRARAGVVIEIAGQRMKLEREYSNAVFKFVKDRIEVMDNVN